jgi:Cu(I)-responsive transcriptional regulator
MPNRIPNKPEMSEARQQGFYNISQAAKLSGISAKMIRHYEKIGLIPDSHRTLANYRIFNEADIHSLIFIKRARSLGFSMKKIATLLDLYNDKNRSSADVKKLANQHIQELEESMLKLQQMTNALRELADHCQGDHRPDCPILEGMSCGVNE